MNNPFERIFTASNYDLKYTWGNNRVSIGECIEKTHTQYGENVDEKTFDRMISVITKGAGSSPIACKRDQTIITNICKYFPQYLTTKVVNNLLKCMQVASYPQSCVTAISVTGYKFTESQIAQLNKLGYAVFDYVESLTYSEFISLFDNGTFLTTFKEDLAVNYDTPDGKIKIDNKIATLKQTVMKYNIVLEEDFVFRLQEKLVGRHFYGVAIVNVLLNLHIIAKGIGIEQFNNSQFRRIFASNSNYCSVCVNTYTNTVEQVARDSIRKIASYYNKPVTRDMIFDMLTVEAFVVLVTPELTNYDPAEDIFYILYYLTTTRYDSMWIVVSHFLEYRYLVVDDFLVLLGSLGLFGGLGTNQNHPMRTIVNKVPEKITDKIVSNIYTFCGYEYIDLLADLKIVPTMENVRRMISAPTMNMMAEVSLFVDDSIIAFVEDVASGEAYQGVATRSMLDSRRLRVYESLSDRDKQIYERLGYVDIGAIIRYRITPTKELIHELLYISDLKTVVFLLHLSDQYDYIMEFIDDDTVVRTGHLLARAWLQNNIVNRDVETFALPNKFYTNPRNVEEDVEKLMLKNASGFNAIAVSQLLTQKREDARRSAVSKMTSTNAVATTNDAPQPVHRKYDSESEDSDDE